MWSVCGNKTTGNKPEDIHQSEGYIIIMGVLKECTVFVIIRHSSHR